MSYEQWQIIDLLTSSQNMRVISGERKTGKITIHIKRIALDNKRPQQNMPNIISLYIKTDKTQNRQKTFKQEQFVIQA